MEYLIVSRHPATIEFIRTHDTRFSNSCVIDGNATEGDVLGNVVAGNLPLRLATCCREVVAVEFTKDPPRGREYGLEDMIKAGAWLNSYRVRDVREEDNLRFNIAAESSGFIAGILVPPLPCKEVPNA